MKELFLKVFKSSQELEPYFNNKIAVRRDRDRRGAVKIAVIDDHPFAAHANLASHNYNIVQFGDISNIDQVKEYDIILCDILGVGLFFNDSLQGASLIIEIKRHYPGKWVLAYTGATLSQTATREAKSAADELIKKDIEINEWIKCLDRYVNFVLNPHVIWTRIRDDLIKRGLSTKDLIIIEDAFTSSILKNKPDSDYLYKSISRSNIPEDAKNIVNGLVSSAIFSLISSGSA